MVKKLIFICVFLILFSSLVFACPPCNDQEFGDLVRENPLKAYGINPDRAVQTDPNILNDDAIAADYFTKNPAKMNANAVLKQKARNYFKNKFGYELNLDGNIEQFNPPTMKSAGTKSTTLNNFNDLPAGTTINVAKDGYITICKAGIDCSNSQMVVTGTIGYDGKSDQFNIDGEVNGNKIEDGRNLKFGPDGIVISGSAKSFQTKNGKIVFDGQQYFAYNKYLDMVVMKNVPKGAILSVEGNVNIMGRDVHLPDGNRINKGTLSYSNGVPSRVGEGSDVLVDGFNHITQPGKNLNLINLGSKKLRDLMDKEEKEISPFKQKHDELRKEYSALYEEEERLEDKMKDLDHKIQEARKNGEKKLMNQLKNQWNDIAKKLDKISYERRKVNDKFVPLKLKIDEISRSYFKKRTDIYNQKLSKLSCNDNCFITGVDRFWAEGDGFRTIMKEGNKIFPEFEDEVFTGSSNAKKGRFSMQMKGGKIYIARNSASGDPLAVGIKSEGKYKLSNGNWDFEADGRNIYGKLDSSGSYLASDIRMGYTTDSGEIKLYDFDVDSRYRMPLSQQEKYNAEKEIEDNEKEIEKIENKINDLFNNDPLVKMVVNGLNEIDKEINENYKQYQHWRKRIRITRDEATDPVERDKVIAEIKQKMKELDKELKQLENDRNDLRNDISYRQVSNLRKDINYHRYEIRKNKRLLVTGHPQKEAFGEIKLSDTQTINTGKGKISYEKFIQGFSVLKNTYVKSHSEGRASSSVVAGGQRLQTPYIVSSNMDILDIDVLKSQECLHTQYRMRFEYLKNTRNPDDISFTIYDGTIMNLGKWRRGEYRGQTFKDGKTKIQYKSTSDKQFINMVMGYMGGVRAHVKKNPTDADGQRGIIPESRAIISNNFDIVNDVDAIKAGDVIIGGRSHGMAVKEVLEIPPNSGMKYIRVFGGSMPAIDPEIYKRLVSLEHLKSDKASVHGYPVSGLLRWKN